MGNHTRKLNKLINNQTERPDNTRNSYAHVVNKIGHCKTPIVIQGVSGGTVNILGSGSMDCSK